MLKNLMSIFSPRGNPDNAPPATVDPAAIYPCLVPSAYLQDLGDAPHWPLGHGICVVLILELKKKARNISHLDLEQLHLSPDQARERAIGNLDKLLASGAVGMKKFTGPQEQPFILMGGHWVAASSILVPVLLQSGAHQLQAGEICVSIPNREALLMFPKGDKAYRDEMLDVIRKNEGDNPRMLTFGLFEYGASGLRPLEQPA